MRDIRIALVIVNCPVAAVGENLASVKRLAGEAAREGAEIVCFPELNLTGYCVSRDLTKTALPVPGPATEEMVRIARSTSLTILAGIAEKDSVGRMYATHLVVTPVSIVKFTSHRRNVSFFLPAGRFHFILCLDLPSASNSAMTATSLNFPPAWPSRGAI
jgi:predicted amidohydrolase